MAIPNRTTLLRSVFFAMMFGAGLAAAPSYAQGAGASMPQAVLQAYQELFALSQKEKKGLMFYVRGQTIGGGVTKVIGNEAVEVRNQTYGRIIIRVDSIDAVAMN